MSSKKSYYGLKRVVTPRGRRWYDTKVGQYVKVDWTRPSLEELVQRIQETLDTNGWEASAGTEKRYQVKKYKRIQKCKKNIHKKEEKLPSLPNDPSFKNGMILISEFFKNSKDVLSKVEESASSTKYDHFKYLISYSCFKFSTDGIKAAKFYSKVVSGAPISGDWILSKEEIADLSICTEILLECLSSMILISRRLKPKNGSVKKFFSECLKLHSIFNKEVVSRMSSADPTGSSVEGAHGEETRIEATPSWLQKTEADFYKWG